MPPSSKFSFFPLHFSGNTSVLTVEYGTLKQPASGVTEKKFHEKILYLVTINSDSHERNPDGGSESTVLQVTPRNRFSGNLSNGILSVYQGT
jgi:hypothetical protein